jgi:alpha-L-fucosidase
MNQAEQIPYEERIEWFHQARFGMFIHYGLYTLMGRGELVLWQERIPLDVYSRLADRFQPNASCIDEWLQLHGEAIYGSKRLFPDYTRHWQGAYTSKGNTVYIMLFRYSSEVPVPLMEPLPARASILSDGRELTVRPGHNRGFVIEGLPQDPPVPIQPVIKLEFDEPPRRISEPDSSAWITNGI